MSTTAASTLSRLSVASKRNRSLQGGGQDRGDVWTGPSAVMGVVGLGRMGEAFARNLLADSRTVFAFDRNPARVAVLREAGAEGAADLKHLRGCDVVLTSLPDDDALTAVALGEGGLVHIMQPGAVHVSMSTVSP